MNYSLSPDIIAKCREKFDASPQIIRLEVNATHLIQQGLYPQAMALRKQKEQLFQQVLVTYQQQISAQVENVNIFAAGLPPEDLQTIERLIVTLFMAIDIIDSCLLDINDTIHHTSEDLFFDHLDDLREMAHMCRDQLNLFSSTQHYYRYAHWGDITDNMYTVMQNKAKSIIRKTNQKENELQQHQDSL